MVLALVGIGGYALHLVRAPFPQTSGELQVPGLQAEVEVIRDDLGIPNIYADSIEDLFFAQGFVHAQDRFWEMDVRRHITAGRLSEMFGASQVPTDTFLRTLGWRRIAEQEVELLSERSRVILNSYSAGVNAYLAERSGGELGLEYSVLSLQNPDYTPEPWGPADSVAWLKALAWDLRGNMGDEIYRAVMSASMGFRQPRSCSRPIRTSAIARSCRLALLSMVASTKRRWQPAAARHARNATDYQVRCRRWHPSVLPPNPWRSSWGLPDRVSDRTRGRWLEKRPTPVNRCSPMIRT